jgi:hypothetical protein
MAPIVTSVTASGNTVGHPAVDNGDHGRGPHRLSHPLGRMYDMPRQLTLLAGERPDWRLDDETRETGKRGVATARAALQAARRRQLDDDPDPRPAAA